MPYAPLALALLSLSLAAVQSPPGNRPAPPPASTPTTVQLMTVVDHVDVFGGMRVRIPNVAIKRVIGPRLAIVGHPRILGIDRSYQPYFRFDKLVVLLPAATALTRGQVVTVTGEVRTLAAARAMGLPLDAPAHDKHARKRMRSGNAPVLVADSVETMDGSALAGGR